MSNPTVATEHWRPVPGYEDLYQVSDARCRVCRKWSVQACTRKKKLRLSGLTEEERNALRRAGRK